MSAKPSSVPYPVVAIGATKGGVGKSTLTFEFAFHCARKGIPVTVIDLDKQATITDLINLRPTENQTPFRYAGAFAKLNPERIGEQIRQNSKNSLVIVDCCGTDGESHRAAMLYCDLYCAIADPSMHCLLTMPKLDVLLSEVKSMRERGGFAPLRSCSLLNKVRSTSQKDAQQAINDLNSSTLLKPIMARICNRKPIEDASGRGLSVSEFKRPRFGIDEQAVNELSEAFDQLLQQLSHPSIKR